MFALSGMGRGIRIIGQSRGVVQGMIMRSSVPCGQSKPFAVYAVII